MSDDTKKMARWTQKGTGAAVLVPVPLEELVQPIDPTGEHGLSPIPREEFLEGYEPAEDE